MSEVNEKPLVTFALFAYNQEKYIREAVEGAFSQTYEPLEIILSDDCSTDRTFEIMREMATDYRGPHEISVRRSPINRGLGLHMQDVANIANGKYIVVAAGDDVSEPRRCTELIRILLSSGAKFASSNHNKISETGIIKELNYKNDFSGNNLWTLINADSSFYAHGASAAYSVDFMKAAFSAARKTVASGKLFHEDFMITTYAVAVNEKPVEYINSGLINYRIVASSLSNFSEYKVSYKSELSIIQREQFYSSTKLAKTSAIREIASNHPELLSKINFDKIAAVERLHKIELASADNSFIVRFRTLLMVRSIDEFRICASRLCGIRLLAFARFIRRKMNSL